MFAYTMVKSVFDTDSEECFIPDASGIEFTFVLS
jgi:hypothetical protein